MAGRFPRIEPGQEAHSARAACGRAAPTGGAACARSMPLPCLFCLTGPAIQPSMDASASRRVHAPSALPTYNVLLQYTAPTVTILLTGRCMCHVFHIAHSLQLLPVVVSSASVLVGFTSSRIHTLIQMTNILANSSVKEKLNFPASTS